MKHVSFGLLFGVLALRSCAPAAVAGDGMRMQDAVPPVFVAGAKAEPGPALESWLVAHRGDEVKLPFTIWRGALGDVEQAALGVVAERPAAALHLSDSALGVSLHDRLQQACGADVRCVVWLSGRFGDAGAFTVLAFHGAVTPEGTLTAWAARPSSCLVIRTQQPIHCARGPKRCKDCREAQEAPAMPKLLDVCPDDRDLVARPVIDLVRDGAPAHLVYDVVQVFADEAEARAFAQAHGIVDMDL